jgi:hypothetical protein
MGRVSVVSCSRVFGGLTAHLSGTAFAVGVLWRTVANTHRGKFLEYPHNRTVCVRGGEDLPGIAMTFGWQHLYEAAILETDRGNLPRLIQTAHTAIHARLGQLGGDNGDSSAERQAIADALAGLRILGEEVGNLPKRPQQPVSE